VTDEQLLEMAEFFPHTFAAWCLFSPEWDPDQYSRIMRARYEKALCALEERRS